MSDDRTGGTSILLRFRRTTYEHTFVKVPVVGDMVKDGALDFQALVAAGTALAKDSRWEVDSELVRLIEPHPTQMPPPEDWNF